MSQPPPAGTSQPEAESSSRRIRNRSISGMTAAQRERKRANDRRSQRASRARTRQHIQHLERELENLREMAPEEGGDENAAIQELIRRNQELQIELVRLQAATSSTQPAESNYGDLLSPGNLQSPSLRESAHTSQPTTYTSGNIPPNDNRPQINSFTHMPHASGVGSLNDTPQTSLNYSLPNQYVGVEIPQNTPEQSNLASIHDERHGERETGDGRYDEQYHTQSHWRPPQTGSSTERSQVDPAFVERHRGTYNNEEYARGEEGSTESLEWEEWPLDEEEDEADSDT
ncbi:hypothetical protein QQS21_010382 [Conoideocrella luteorostrata]|uniref:BZIP domain-containing protein n=1 Tax=Conoideocrella luteorostrata TaxID=1105319 RepID=A0AAJ0CFF9_9HYPO|nr:hypothetical protein QQS21_010382 [Conoideocrella luteorostrata]